jgi:predicted transcriptional regulator
VIDRVVTLTVSSRDASRARFISAAEGEKQGDYVVFEKAADLARLLAESRVRILESMAGKGALSIGQIARMVRRGTQVVQDDIRALVDAGVIVQNDNTVEVAYGAIRVDFFIQSKSQPEPPRVRWRLLLLREWSHEQVHQVFP